MCIPDPDFSHPGSRDHKGTGSLIRIRYKELVFLTQTFLLQALGNMMRDIYPGSRFKNTDTIRNAVKLANGRFALAKNSVDIFSTPEPEVKKSTVCRILKVPKREIFDCSDFPEFYTIMSLRVGDFGVKIKKILNNI
jgi:hypothetical protein